MRKAAWCHRLQWEAMELILAAEAGASIDVA